MKEYAVLLLKPYALRPGNESIPTYLKAQLSSQGLEIIEELNNKLTERQIRTYQNAIGLLKSIEYSTQKWKQSALKYLETGYSKALLVYGENAIKKTCAIKYGTRMHFSSSIKEDMLKHPHAMQNDFPYVVHCPQNSAELLINLKAFGFDSFSKHSLVRGAHHQTINNLLS